MVDWLTDLSWVPNGAVVFITAAAAGGAHAKRPKHSSDLAASHTSFNDKRDTSTAPAKSGNDKHPREVTAQGNMSEGVVKREGEDEDETLALAALGRIRESYKKRAKGRESERDRGGAGSATAEQEASKHMLEKKRVVEQTDRFKQVIIDLHLAVNTRSSRPPPRKSGDRWITV